MVVNENDISAHNLATVVSLPVLGMGNISILLYIMILRAHDIESPR